MTRGYPPVLAGLFCLVVFAPFSAFSSQNPYSALGLQAPKTSQELEALSDQAVKQAYIQTGQSVSSEGKGENQYLREMNEIIDAYLLIASADLRKERLASPSTPLDVEGLHSEPAVTKTTPGLPTTWKVLPGMKDREELSYDLIPTSSGTWEFDYRLPGLGEIDFGHTFKEAPKVRDDGSFGPLDIAHLDLNRILRDHRLEIIQWIQTRPDLYNFEEQLRARVEEMKTRLGYKNASPAGKMSIVKKVLIDIDDLDDHLWKKYEDLEPNPDKPGDFRKTNPTPFRDIFREQLPAFIDTFHRGPFNTVVYHMYLKHIFIQERRRVVFDALNLNDPDLFNPTEGNYSDSPVFLDSRLRGLSNLEAGHIFDRLVLTGNNEEQFYKKLLNVTTLSSYYSSFQPWDTRKVGVDILAIIERSDYFKGQTSKSPLKILTDFARWADGKSENLMLHVFLPAFQSVQFRILAAEAGDKAAKRYLINHAYEISELAKVSQEIKGVRPFGGEIGAIAINIREKLVEKAPGYLKTLIRLRTLRFKECRFYLWGKP